MFDTDSEFWDEFTQENKLILNAASNLSSVQQEAKKNAAPNTKQDIKYFDKERFAHVSWFKEFVKKKVYINDFLRQLHLDLKKDSMYCPVNSFSKVAISKYNKFMYKLKVNLPDDIQKMPDQNRRNLMPYLDAYRIFINKYLKPVFLEKENGKSFVIDSNNEHEIVQIIKYFIRDTSCKLPFNKGIGLIGSVGTGKSTIMMQMSKFTKDYDLPTKFDFVSMDDIYEGAEDDGLSSMKKFKFRDICIDEFGDRLELDNKNVKKIINSYGTKIDCFQELTKRRYKRFALPQPGMTHIASNIDFDRDNDQSLSEYERKEALRVMRQQYGAREIDRVKHMFTWIWLGGPSRR